MVSLKQQNSRGGKAGLHPNSLANLQPRYQPGQSGNSKGYSLKSRLLDILIKSAKDGDIDPQTIGDKVVLATIQGALERESTALNIVWDRCDGKLTDDKAPGDTYNTQFNIVVETPGAEGMVKRWLAGERTNKELPGG